ncbi:pyroglutamyl-peptidase 1 isoform X3 [Talpa occidentalis]|uniref:pyroglutamyl-peptidase 1 isoform X3 n=1 Tax=Talpa occidentalis TaxID=50954 RepID=UPI0023FA3539|nr:pyroglutamyl-peptidase 1 isoform X3 [Talpa occidentalis]
MYPLWGATWNYPSLTKDSASPEQLWWNRCRTGTTCTTKSRPRIKKSRSCCRRCKNLPRELEKLGLGDSVDLHVYEIPVEYKTVQRLIPALWEKHSPQLVVHVGVSGMATTVTLEKCGHNKGYKGLDNCRFCPGSQCCVEDGPESIDSIIDMDAVCKRVTTLGLDVSVTISQDAGRYLCDFTYYTSLYQSHGRSAFVHVPPLGKPYNADQLGRALQAIIEEMLDLLEQSEGKINCHHKH